MDSKKVTRELAKELSSIRQKKIQRLKQRISSGTYQIRNDKVAKAIFYPR